jgi:hypothetical protein
MADTGFHEVEKGSTFATYQGPLCAVRLDWNAATLRAIMAGHTDGACAQVVTQRWEVMLRTAPNLVMFYDLWDVTGYESPFRIQLTEWVNKRRDKITLYHVLLRSKIVAMGASVAALATQSNVKTYTKRPDFDIAAKKAGFPLNPPLPPVLGVKQF